MRRRRLAHAATAAHPGAQVFLQAHRASRVARERTGESLVQSSGCRLEPGHGRGGAGIAQQESGGFALSQRTVHLVIGRLLTDEELREAFARRPVETLTYLRAQGFELTDDEVAALIDSDPAVWPSMAARIHPRLQRCSLARG